MQEINLEEVEFSAGSLVDDVGRVFYWKHRLFRAINYNAVSITKEILTCGLLDELIQNNLFPKTWTTEYSLEGYGLIIEHEKISRITYPFEWSFSMLRDAAITVLNVNIIAAKYGFETKDCHGYNVLFDGLFFKFIDFGSFIKKQQKNSWIAYEEFLRCYYYPLQIWQDENYFLAKRILSGWEIMPAQSYFLYKYPVLRNISPIYLNKLIKNYLNYKRLASIDEKKIRQKLPKRIGQIVLTLLTNDLLPFQKVDLNKLINQFKKMHYENKLSFWANYHDTYSSEGQFTPSPRFLRIMEIIKSLEISSVIEFGGNQGLLSQFLLQNTEVKEVICTDYDEQAVDYMYRLIQKDNIKLIPVILNAIFPNTGFRLDNPEKRFSTDAVLALALTHHLILSQNISINEILDIFSRYTKRFAFIEFMPLGLYDGKSAPPVPAWYTQEWFKAAFERYFTIILEEQLEENRILFVGIKK